MNCSSFSPSEASPEREADGGELHVLAVDDSIVERMLLERMLKNSAYKVTTAENGVRALEYLSLLEDARDGTLNKAVNHVPQIDRDLVLKFRQSSHRVQEDRSRSGFEVAEHTSDQHSLGDLRKKRQRIDVGKPLKHETSYLKEIPVVIMSSENIPARIEKCLEEGAQEFMLKPIRQSDVKRLRCHAKNFSEATPGRLCLGI
ncbi:Two-component response regulator ARR17 [Apostasia shenzhenica]|uniref:Two-component response regulator ARR17 n=1 Tax=Apostasia shenzhenica TaxID=1088818 RepID=A0A2I0A4U4_9ASPA|nr:Two-component response regulator ARR17 [Apostasia shenzhenica]